MASTMALLLIGLIAGVAGGMFGIGGGAIMVPALVILIGMSQKGATGTSIAAQVLPIGLLGALVYLREGNLDLRAAIWLALGLIVGNLLGAVFVNQPFVSDRLVKKLYGVFLVAIGARYLVWDALARSLLTSR